MPFNVTALQQMRSAFLDAWDATFTGVKRGNLGGYPVEYRPEDQVRVNKQFAATLLSEITGGVSDNDPEKLRQIKAEIAKNSFFKSDIDHPLSGRELAKVVGDCLELIRQAYGPRAHILVPDDKELEAEVLKQMSTPQGLKTPLTEDEKHELEPRLSGLHTKIKDLNNEIDLGRLWSQQAHDKALKMQKDFVHTKVQCMNMLESLHLPQEFKRLFRRDILKDQSLNLGQDGVNQYKAMLSTLKDVKVEDLVKVLDDPNSTAQDITNKLLSLADAIYAQYTSAMQAIGSDTCEDLCRTTMCRMLLAKENCFRELFGRIPPDKQNEIGVAITSSANGGEDKKALDKANIAADLLNLANDMALLPKPVKHVPYNDWSAKHSVKGVDCQNVEGTIGSDLWLKNMKVKVFLPNKKYQKGDENGQGEFTPEYGMNDSGLKIASESDNQIPYYTAPAQEVWAPRNEEQTMLYTYTLDSFNVNKALWTGKYKTDNKVRGREEYSVNDLRQAQVIDHCLNAHRTTAALRLFAGVRGEFLQKNLYKATDGTLKFRCEAFQSTSRDWKLAKGFSKQGNETDSTNFPVIVFDVPPNYPAVALDKVSSRELEKEILLNQGSSGTVYDIQQRQEYDFYGEKRTVTFYFVRLEAR